MKFNFFKKKTKPIFPSIKTKEMEEKELHKLMDKLNEKAGYPREDGGILSLFGIRR